jgi:hypothetical protein
VKRILLALLALFALDAHAAVRCSGTPCADSTGGFSSPVTTDPVVATGVWTFGASAGAANAVAAQETAGCITFEGATADAFETRVCGNDPTKDGQLLLSTTAADGVQLATPFNGGAGDPISISPGTYQVFQVNGPNFVNMRSNAYMCFAAGLPSDGCMGGLIRGPDPSGAGLQVAGGTTGATVGYIQAAQLRNVQITTYTTTAPDSGTIFTNTGDADGATITLLNDPPANPQAVWYDFAVTAAFTLTIQPSAGETLYGAAGATCSTLASSVVGSIAHVVATTGGSGAIWMTQLNGTWVCTP